MNVANKENKSERFEALTDKAWAWLTSGRESVLLFCLIGFSIGVFLLNPQADIDLFTRVAVGRLIEILGDAPRVDHFVFTSKKPLWYDHEHVTGYLFYKALMLFGSRGILLLKIFFAAATLFILRAAQKEWGKASAASLIFLAFLWLDISNIWNPNIRAQVATYLGFAVYLWAFCAFRATSRIFPLYVLPPVTVIWVNSHGGFPVGLSFFAIFLGVLAWESDVRFWRGLLPFVLCCLAMAVNPYGIDFIFFMVKAILTPRDIVGEWGWLPLYTPQALFIIGFMTWLALVIFKRRLSPGLKNRDASGLPLEGLLFLLLSGYEGMRHMRFSPLFMMTVAAYAPLYCESMVWFAGSRAKSFMSSLRRACLVFFFCAGIWGYASLLATWHRYELDYSEYPVKACEWLRTYRKGGNVALHFNEGSYALWRLYPKFLVSVDGRFEEVFEIPTLKRINAAVEVFNPVQKEAFRELKADYVLIKSESPAIKERRNAFPGFEIIYSDKDFSILGKEPNEPGIPSYFDREVFPIWRPLF